MNDGWNTEEIRIRYKDTDRMGVVYYGNYLTFFEVGRSGYMRELGYPYAQLEGAGNALAVIEAWAKYHSNAGYDALIRVKTAVTEIRGARIRFDYEIYSEDNRLLVTGYTVHACVGADNSRPKRLPEPLIGVLKDKIIKGSR